MGLITHNSLVSEHTLAKLTSRGRSLIPEEVEGALQLVKTWIEQIESLPATLRKEQRLESSFISLILCNLLGHKQIGHGREFSLLPKDGNGQGIPDLKVGFFATGDQYSSVVPKMLIELKGPGCLDFHRPQPGRQDKKSPAEQVISDMFNEEGECEFGVVSNLVDFELFSRRFATKRSIIFSLRKLTTEDDLAILFSLLSPTSALLIKGSETLEFRKKEVNKQKLSKDFFTIFKNVRQTLLENLEDHVEDSKLNRVSTRILSQIVFVLYGETIGLLPRGSLKTVLESDDYSWNVYRKFCEALDKGNTLRGVELFGYNGGLFSIGNEFDFRVPGKPMDALKPLLNFEFRDSSNEILEQSEVREALGRVLEHALEVNDEERLYNFTKEGPFADARRKQAARNERQQKGVFYTPAFVTKYMVEKVGELLQSSGKDLSKSTWLDPACGSGAFLLEIFDYLKQHELSKVGFRRPMERLGGGHEAVLSTIEGRVVSRIRGIDFDPLAVGISQLNVSMKCSRPYEKLPVLGKGVTESDSLFDENRYKYDVIIGNPPYMQWRYVPEEYREWLKEDRVYKSFADASSDYSVFFFVAALKRLKPGGLLAFIATNKLLAASEAEVFREWLLNHFDLVEVLDFRERVFKGTDIEPCIYILKKKANSAIIALHHRDVFSFTKSEGHLEVLKATRVPGRITRMGPYKAIPSRSSTAMIAVIRWIQSKKDKLSSIGSVANIKAGMRVTDIAGDDVIVGARGTRLLAYEPLYDGASVQQGRLKPLSPERRVLRTSIKLESWKRNLPRRGWFVLVKELSTRIAVAVKAGRCPAALNSLTLVYGSEGGLRTARHIALWLQHPLAEGWVEFWFGANRTHSNQRWKEVYLGKVPCPESLASGGSFDWIPNWVTKECLLFLEGEFREVDAKSWTAPQTSDEKRHLVRMV